MDTNSSYGLQTVLSYRLQTVRMDYKQFLWIAISSFVHKYMLI